MKRARIRGFFPWLTVLVTASLPALAAEVSDHKLSEWNFGQVLFGEKLSKADLKGKVVVVENWGVHCPPCVASLPHLAELDKKKRDKGLRIIGVESQGSSKEMIKPLIEKAKVEYTIVSGDQGPIEVTGIPRAFVFGVDGKLVYDGHPMDEGFEGAIKKALREVKQAEPATATPTGPLVATRSWTNSDGREIRAAVKKADDTTVTFLMANGREVSYPMDKLSAESRQAIVDANKAATPSKDTEEE